MLHISRVRPEMVKASLSVVDGYALELAKCLLQGRLSSERTLRKNSKYELLSTSTHSQYVFTSPRKTKTFRHTP